MQSLFLKTGLWFWQRPAPSGAQDPSAQKLLAALPQSGLPEKGGQYLRASARTKRWTHSSRRPGAGGGMNAGL
ncbi:hypothetical protein, partial [Verminephrobacter aporrectodeae]|uniref:hypothetical protein n=1 Tax=Verminephrobacter aporrectodeae TaxID=1110389 RepID=UPI002243F62E